jgi:Zn-dependent protease with chaperone function
MPHCIFYCHRVRQISSSSHVWNHEEFQFARKKLHFFSLVEQNYAFWLFGKMPLHGRSYISSHWLNNHPTDYYRISYLCSQLSVVTFL